MYAMKLEKIGHCVEEFQKNAHVHVYVVATCCIAILYRTFFKFGI